VKIGNLLESENQDKFEDAGLIKFLVPLWGRPEITNKKRLFSPFFDPVSA
jgi:hypothetical protein